MIAAEELKEKIIECLQTIFDPEIPVSIFELGLIYEINILPLNNVQINMTLTAPSCPSAQEIPVEVEQKVRAVEGVADVDVAVVWSPPWDRTMMSESAQLELGFL
ncbi:FeS assembly SUF system protein [Pedobacter sp. UYEF25]